MRRYSGHMHGERYCGNVNKYEVHDLDNEKTNCQIDEIIKAGHDKPFDMLDSAHKAGMDDCAWCLGK
jgi:hypothetical protein